MTLSDLILAVPFRIAEVPRLISNSVPCKVEGSAPSNKSEVNTRSPAIMIGRTDGGMV